MKRLSGIVSFVFVILAVSLYGQDSRPIILRAIVADKDTIPVIDLKPFVVFSPRVFSNRAEEQRYYRLVYNVKKVYPYASLAGRKLEEYNRQIMAQQTDLRRRRLIREIEKEIRNEYEAELMRLTRSQGHILIKLIDRQTRHTSYDILKDYRGGVSAIFWQSLGRIFGYNLRTQYDPEGEDRQIEEIVKLIEAGIL